MFIVFVCLLHYKKVMQLLNKQLVLGTFYYQMVLILQIFQVNKFLF
jgi:hypothetical protein